MSSDFFKQIPRTTRFVGVIDEENFYPAPNDWIIVIADIRGSTKAVSEGRYKDVNMIGGSAICAVQNATGCRDWPFVFGGDGATLLIAPEERDVVEAALVRTRSLARDEFELDLRIGFVPVGDVLELGTDVLVARYEVTPGNSFAMFGGGGVELADELIKNADTSPRYAVPEYTLPGMPDLTGLSCRWEALGTQKGSILCLLVRPLADDFQHKQSVLSAFLESLTEIIGDELSQASPVTASALRFRWPPKGLAAEAKATRANRSYWSRVIELYAKTFVQWILERYNLRGGGYDGATYRDELRKNSDYCKFDDMLRMVLDCTADQVSRIRLLLEDMQSRGEVDFGVFETEHAQITCLLFDLESSQHLHFVDGTEGGFYAASKALKKQAEERGGTGS